MGNDLQEGDLVRLKSGSIIMTVDHFGIESFISCISYNEKTGFQTILVKETSLVKVTDEELKPFILA